MTEFVWRLVPAAPTPEMLRAGADASPLWATDSAQAYALAVNDVGDVWEAMLAAAPTPPTKVPA